MMRRIVLIITLVAVPLVTLLGYYFHSDVRGELVDPYVGSELVSPTPQEMTDMISDVPIACILEHGTFDITQQECDEMLNFQNNPDPTGNFMTCEIPEGTFLVNQRECEILRNAKGSSDVTKRIDE